MQTISDTINGLHLGEATSFEGFNGNVVRRIGDNHPSGFFSIRRVSVAGLRESPQISRCDPICQRSPGRVIVFPIREQHRWRLPSLSVDDPLKGNEKGVYSAYTPIHQAYAALLFAKDAANGQPK